MGVRAANGVATLWSSPSDRLLLDLLGAAEPRLAPLLRHLRQGVRAINPLQEGVDAVAEPAQDGVAVEEIIVNVPVEEQHAPTATRQDVLVHDADAEQMRDDLGGTVVIAADPDDVKPIGEFANQRENLPVVLLQPTEVDGIEHIAVQDETTRRQQFLDVLQQLAELMRLAVVAAQVQVGKD